MAAPESSLPSVIRMKCSTSEKYIALFGFLPFLLDNLKKKLHCGTFKDLLLSVRGRAWRTEVAF